MITIKAIKQASPFVALRQVASDNLPLCMIWKELFISLGSSHSTEQEDWSHVTTLKKKGGIEREGKKKSESERSHSSIDC